MTNYLLILGCTTTGALLGTGVALAAWSRRLAEGLAVRLVDEPDETETSTSTSPAPPAVPGQLTIDDVLDGLDRIPAPCYDDDPAGADELAPAPAGCGPWLLPRHLVPGLAALAGAAQALDDRHVALTCSPSGVPGFAHVTYHGCDAGLVLAGELRTLGLDGMAGLLVDWCAGEVVEVGSSGELCYPPSRDDVLAAF